MSTVLAAPASPVERKCRMEEVFDQNFQQLTNKTGTFADSSIPTGFAPFGIQAIGSKLYVTYAKQDAGASGDVLPQRPAADG